MLRGQCFQSLMILTFFFSLLLLLPQPQEFGLLEQSVKPPGRVLRPHSWLVWVASNWGDSQWRAKLKMVMLLLDSLRTQPSSRVMHSSNLCNYKQGKEEKKTKKKKMSLLAFLKMNVPRSSRETFTCLSFSSWMGFNEASQMCVCVCSVHMHVCASALF